MSASPFTGRLVPRFPSCPPPPGQAAAADAPEFDLRASAALSHSCPAPHGQAAAVTDAPPASVTDETASGFGHTLPDAAFTIFTIRLSPAVALILRLVETARADLERDEIFARAIGIYAQQLGIPTLARDLPDVPDFERNAPTRYRSGGP